MEGGDCITETHGVQCPLEMCVFRQVWEASRPMIMCATPLKKMASCVCFSDGSVKYITKNSGFYFWKFAMHVRRNMGLRHGFSIFFWSCHLKHYTKLHLSRFLVPDPSLIQVCVMKKIAESWQRFVTEKKIYLKGILFLSRSILPDLFLKLVFWLLDGIMQVFLREDS